MGIGNLFHKIRIGFVRKFEPTIPSVSSTKKYGNYGEDKFVYQLRASLPSCKIKRNVIIHTSEGNAEIDCLVLFQNKLFAIEVKYWKGKLMEREDGFLQSKTDRWTGEIHSKYHKSPFKQLGRAIYLLRKEIPDAAWINPIVFFADDELESLSVYSDQPCFYRMDLLVRHIRNSGKESYNTRATSFFQKCVAADYLFANAWGKSLLCVISNDSLWFETTQGIAFRNNIISIRITHHWSYDELFIKMIDGSVQHTTLENGKLLVNDNGAKREYALCKLDYIELGGH